MLRHVAQGGEDNDLASRNVFSLGEKASTVLFLQMLHYINQKNSVDGVGRKNSDNLIPARLHDDVYSVRLPRYDFLEPLNVLMKRLATDVNDRPYVVLRVNAATNIQHSLAR